MTLQVSRERDGSNSDWLDERAGKYSRDMKTVIV